MDRGGTTGGGGSGGGHQGHQGVGMHQTGAARGREGKEAERGQQQESQDQKAKGRPRGGPVQVLLTACTRSGTVGVFLDIAASAPLGAWHVGRAPAT